MDDSIKERPHFLFRLLEGTFMAMAYATRFLSFILPPSLLYLIPRSMGAVFFYARPGMRRRLEAKISDAMPEISDPHELSRIGRQACGSMFMPIFDVFTLSRHGERYMQGLSIEGEENLAEAEALGKGVILTGAHIGALAIAHAVMARLGKPYTPIAFNPDNTIMPRYIEFLEFYGGFLGCDVEEPVFFVGEEDIIPRVRQHLASGKRIGINFDVDGSGTIEFFGRPAALTSGLAYFSYDTGAPVIVVALLRGKRPLENRMVILEPIFCDPTAERTTEVARVMREVTRKGEQLIRMAPGQWMSWFGLWQWWDTAREILERKEKAGSS
jgi:lauroyl/myristoyl acyltransferase